MKWIRAVAGCVVIAAALPALAANGWYGGIHVRGITVVNDGFALFTDATVADCGTRGKFTFSSSLKEGNKMYALALAAELSGQPVSVYVNAGDGCNGDAMPASGIYISQQ